MSIDAISSQSSIFAPTTQAASSQATAFELEPDQGAAEASEPGAKSLKLTPMTSDEMQARLARFEEERPDIEARDKALQEQKKAWIDYLKGGIAARNDQPYGQVVKNGQVVATVYNSGAMSGPGANMIDPDHPADMKGPEVAQWRAEQIAKAFGGTVVRQDTAQSQSAWAADQADNPPIQGFMAWRVASGFAEAVDRRPYVRHLSV